MLKHEQIEKNVGLLIVLTVLLVSFGGLVEIVPLFFQKFHHPAYRSGWQDAGTGQAL